jgi:hypothetical protein
VGEKTIDGDDCFVLRVDADPLALRARSSADVEVVRHAIWGYFSQRTGLLDRLEDSHLLRIRMQGASSAQTAYWETSMESSIGDYRAVNGINIAHAGRTVVSLSRFGSSANDQDDGSDTDVLGSKRTCTCMEETWSIEEVDFNIMGLSTECFLPPRDLVPCSSKPVEKEHCAGLDHSCKKEDAVGTVPATSAVVGSCDPAAVDVKYKNSDGGVRPLATARKALVPAGTGLSWFGTAKVVAVDTAAE